MAKGDDDLGGLYFYAVRVKGKCGWSGLSTSAIQMLESDKSGVKRNEKLYLYNHQI